MLLLMILATVFLLASCSARKEVNPEIKSLIINTSEDVYIVDVEDYIVRSEKQKIYKVFDSFDELRDYVNSITKINTNSKN